MDKTPLSLRTSVVAPLMDLLWKPLSLAGHLMPNRIIFGAHVTNFGKGQVFTERHFAYYGARSAGGVGMIVTEGLTVHPLDVPYEHVPFGYREEIIPSLVHLAERLRNARTGEPPLVLAQLNHTGGQSSGRILRQSPWAPSAVADVASKKMARAMEPGQIEEVVEGFARTAERVVMAGLDGVELNGGQYSLLRQFLSPLTNLRDDDYGGSLENRVRFLVQVLAAVRGAVGKNAVLGLKLCGDELAPWGGLTPADCAEVARRVAVEACPDYFSIQCGGPFSVHMTDPGMPIAEGFGSELAEGVRCALTTPAPPVFVEGRIEQGATAMALLAEGKADGVVMTRALISDPELAAKLSGSISEPVRPHVAMQRYFSVRGDWNRPLGDLANPRAGREALLPPLVALENPASALVIGGGPAGMEAAITLACQGRAVHLVESSPRLGGLALELAEAVPAREEFRRLTDYQMEMVRRLGVTVELGRTIHGYEENMASFGAVYLAVGAVSRPPPFPGTVGVPCLSARALISPREGMVVPPAASRGALAVVVDLEYGFRMAAAVERMLELGYAVEVVTDDLFVGRELVESAEMLWFQRVGGQGVRFRPRTRVVEASEGSLVCKDRFSGEEIVLGPLAAVIHAQRENPVGGLWTTLGSRHPRVIPIGDARAPRLMGEAILDAHRSVVGG